MKTASIAKTLLSVAFAAATVTFVQAQPKESAIVAHRGYWNCKEGGYARMDEILQSAGEEGGRYQDGQWVTVLGLVTAVRKKATKSSSQMAFVTLEDMYGALTALVFSRPLEQYGWRTANRSRRSINTWLRRRNTPKRCWSSR